MNGGPVSRSEGVHVRTCVRGVCLCVSVCLCVCVCVCLCGVCTLPILLIDPFYWYWLPMAKKPFSDETVSTYLPKLQDEGFVEGLVEDIRNLFKVVCSTLW